MNKARTILLVISFLALVFSLVSVARMLLGDRAEQRKLEALGTAWAEAAGGGQGEVAASPPIPEAQEPVMLPEFQALYERNPDIVGWLELDGTRINYPVMQNVQDTEYYLDHDFDRQPSQSGLPFLDKNSRIDGSGILLIHGHHMKNGSMFTDLMKYKKESFYQEHATLQFSTLYEKEEYEIVAVILSQVYRKSDDVFKYYRIEQADTPEGFAAYVENIRRLALYDTGVTAKYGDRLIVLSTCEYSTENGRLAVVARKAA